MNVPGSVLVTRGSYHRFFPDVDPATDQNNGTDSSNNNAQIYFKLLSSSSAPSLMDQQAPAITTTTMTVIITRPPKPMRLLVDEIVGFSVLAIFTVFILAVLFLCLWANGKCYKRNKKTSRCCPHIDSRESSIIFSFQPEEQVLVDYYEDNDRAIITGRGSNAEPSVEGVTVSSHQTRASTPLVPRMESIVSALKLTKRRYTDMPNRATKFLSGNRHHCRRSRQHTVSTSQPESEPTAIAEEVKHKTRSQSSSYYSEEKQGSESDNDDMAQATFGIDSLKGKKEYAKFIKERIMRLQSQQPSTTSVSTSPSAVKLNADALAAMQQMQDQSGKAGAGSSAALLVSGGPVRLSVTRENEISQPSSSDTNANNLWQPQAMKIGRFTIRTLSSYTPASTPSSPLGFLSPPLVMLRQPLSSGALTTNEITPHVSQLLRPYSYSVSIKRKK